MSDTPEFDPYISVEVDLGVRKATHYQPGVIYPFISEDGTDVLMGGYGICAGLDTHILVESTRCDLPPSEQRRDTTPWTARYYTKVAEMVLPKALEYAQQLTPIILEVIQELGMELYTSPSMGWGTLYLVCDQRTGEVVPGQRWVQCFWKNLKITDEGEVEIEKPEHFPYLPYPFDKDQATAEFTKWFAFVLQCHERN